MLGHSSYRLFASSPGFRVTGTARSSRGLDILPRTDKARIVEAIDIFDFDRLVRLFADERPEDALEMMQVNMNGSEANLAFPGMLNEQLAGFAGSLEDADTAPTSQQQTLFTSLHQKLEAQLALWKVINRN